MTRRSRARHAANVRWHGREAVEVVAVREGRPVLTADAPVEPAAGFGTRRGEAPTVGLLDVQAKLISRK